MDNSLDPIILGAEIFHLIDQAHMSDDPLRLVELHEEAYKLSDDLPKNHELRGACAFNLGAAHIENQNYRKGLDFLKKATELYNSNSSNSDNYEGDLHFNLAIAKYRLGEFVEAFDLLTKAIGDYQRTKEDGFEEMITECWQTMRQIVCDTATRSSENQPDGAINKLETATRSSKIQSNEFRKKLETCRFKKAMNEEESRVWNELGLLNTQLHQYNEASECFQKAEELVGTGRQDQLRAVILQNRGALCNFLGEYEKSIEFHREALDLFKSGSILEEKRIGEGQCHLNMAHAYCRWEGPESEKAREEFEATKDIVKDKDKHMLWQACEGLGAVLYNQGKYLESVNNYREASKNVFDTANSERINAKFEKALRKLQTEDLKNASEEKVSDTKMPTNEEKKRKSSLKNMTRSKTSPNT